MIKEIIVVEGKSDIAAVKKSVEADCIATHGVKIAKDTLKEIKTAYKTRGIIILTDPDSAGEHIRRILATRFPRAKHAFVPVEAATANGDIGIEQADASAIRNALDNLHTEKLSPVAVFDESDMRENGLVGADKAAENRAKLGAALGIGFANAKIFLKRLNNYGINREEFFAKLREIKGE